MRDALFTIIIAAHGRPWLLGRTLKSLLDQTCQDFFVIVVADEALSPPPYEELKGLAGRYLYILRSGVPGPAESRNLGLELTKTDYVVFLDDDDTFEPNHLAALAEQIDPARPQIAYCSFKLVDEDREAIPPKILKVSAAYIGSVNPSSHLIRGIIPNSCLVFSTSITKNIRFDSSLVIYEDWDFLLEAMKIAELTYINVNSVLIHKSWGETMANQRRGSSHNDRLVEQTLLIYRKHPAPEEIRKARQNFFLDAGLTLPLELF